MGKRKSISKAAMELKRALQDKRNQAELKAEVLRRLKKGKADLIRFERKLKSRETREKLKERAKAVQKKYKSLKQRFLREQKKASVYTRQNPEKALSVAAAAGKLAGALWATLRPKSR